MVSSFNRSFYLFTFTTLLNLFFYYIFLPDIAYPVLVFVLVLIIRTGSMTSSSTTSTLTALLAFLVALPDPVLVFPVVPSTRSPPTALQTFTFTVTPCVCVCWQSSTSPDTVFSLHHHCRCSEQLRLLFAFLGLYRIIVYHLASSSPAEQ